MKRIKKNDLVKITTGANKGRLAKVERIDGNKVYLEGIREVERHYRATSYNQGGKRDVKLPIDISNVALVVDDTKNAEKVSKVSYQVKDDKKTRIAKINGKEVK